MVITTGMISPSWSLADVFALNALQNSMMLTPCGPSAVPTGGAGVALPAGICNFTEPVIFFAILLSRSLFTYRSFTELQRPLHDCRGSERPRSAPLRSRFAARRTAMRQHADKTNLT